MDAINMVFVVVLPKNRRQHDSIWVIVDMMTKFAHFILLKYTYRAEDYARPYIYEILIWHGIPLSIISDRGAQFTSHFWRSSKKSMGTLLTFSTTFHPHTDGRKRTPFKH